MEGWKENISFVLIEPKEPGNIGASARAMKNMGFTHLELVNPRPLTEEGKRMAVHAVEVMENAVVHKGFKDAIRDKGLVIGTTRRIGKRRGLILPLKDGIRRAITAAKKNRVAILFGREDRGLKNMEVGECGFLITIPTEPSSPSLNLAQSVLLVAYELGKKTYKAESPALVDQNELKNLYQHMRSSLKTLEYIPRGNRDLEAKIMRNLKHLFGRSGLTEWEMGMLHGICSQIERKMSREETGVQKTSKTDTPFPDTRIGLDSRERR